MSFQFVENSKIDGTTRKLIRSHVMKGKNIGKIRPRSTRKRSGDVPLSDSINESCFEITAFSNNFNKSMTNLITIPSTVGNTFTFLTFPCPLQPYMRNLISHFLSTALPAVYPLEFCLPVDVKKIIFFEYLQADEAFFHSTLAMSEVTLDSRLGRKETSPEALHHLSNSYRCISQNLQKDQTPSDQTIAAVLTMALHEDFRGHPERSKVHIDALERMVELRGGIAQFGSSHILIHKICRADIEYALHAGSHPRFNRDQFPREVIQSMLEKLDSQKEIFHRAAYTQGYDPELRAVIMDLMSACILVNDNRDCFKFEPYAYQEILISVSYRLLHRFPLAGSGPKNKNENAWYLGILAWMITVLFQRGRFQPLLYDILAGKFWDVIEDTASSELIEHTTFLWLLFIGGISISDVNNWNRLFPPIKKCLFTLNIDSWQNAWGMIKEFPWIDAFHNKQGHELWQALVWG